MGTRGPAPKRSDQKAGHAREANPKAPSKVRMKGAVTVPDPRPDWRDEVVQWYQSLRTSGQMVHAEPSDWQYALITGDALEDAYADPTAAKWANVRGMLGDLGTHEVARRRAGIEIEREQQEDHGAEEAMAELRILRGGGDA